MKGKVMHVMSQKEVPASEKTAEEHGEIPGQDGKAGNGEGLAPALIDCWCYLSRTGIELKDGLGEHGNAFGLTQEWSTFLKT